jgi:hypothetical protein
LAIQPRSTASAGASTPRKVDLAIQRAVDAPSLTHQKLLIVGSTGAGKTAQIWTLPGRKFAYLFDPAAMATLRGCPDLDYKEFLPEFAEMDATLKKFNKDGRSDQPSSKREPVLYQNWIDDINAREEAGFFASYDWLCIDSITLLTQAIMDRQLFINNRYGDVQDRGDYRVVGNKLGSVFRTITSLPINLYCTGHLDTYEDEDTKRIVTQLRLPGSARGSLPIIYSNIWKVYGKGKDKYFIRTVPEERGGFQDIRTTLPGLDEDHDVSIADFKKASGYGIGKILLKSGFRIKAASSAAPAQQEVSNADH